MANGEKSGDLAGVVAQARKLVESIPKSRDGWELTSATPYRSGETRDDEGKRYTTDVNGHPHYICTPTTPEAKATVVTLAKLQGLVDQHLGDLRYLVSETPGCKLYDRTQCHQMLNPLDDPWSAPALWWLSICPTGCMRCRSAAVKELDAIEAILPEPKKRRERKPRRQRDGAPKISPTEQMALTLLGQNIQRRKFECLGWSIGKWADKIGCHEKTLAPSAAPEFRKQLAILQGKYGYKKSGKSKKKTAGKRKTDAR